MCRLQLKCNKLCHSIDVVLSIMYWQRQSWWDKFTPGGAASFQGSRLFVYKLQKSCGMRKTGTELACVSKSDAY